MRIIGLLLLVALATACEKGKPAAQAAVERGLGGIEQSRSIQQQSRKWIAPTNDEAERAIRVLESARGAVRTLLVRDVVPQEQFDQYLAKATLNGQDRTYVVEHDASGTWVAAAGGTNP